MIGVLRQALLVVIAAGALAFADAPFRTLGQRWLARRSRERVVLLAAELALYALWLVVKVGGHGDRPLCPGADVPLARAGALVVVAGVTLAVWAKLTLGRWFSAEFGVKQDHPLLTGGPYAVTRHPIYTGILATLAGGALAWNSALTLALAALMAVALWLHTVHEEALFVAQFGEAYRDYRRRVPRLAPWPRPGGAGAQPREGAAAGTGRPE